MLEEFKACNQVAYERYASLTKQEQGIMDRWQALEYRLNPPAALVTGNQNSKLFGRNDHYGIFDTRQPVGYDKGKEGGGNELSQAGQGWGQPNRTNPGRPNAYAEYLAYKQKVQARQQSLALEQALQQLLVQEQAARTYAGPQAFAYNGADGFTGSGYETGGAAGAGSSGGIDGGYEAGDSFKQGGLDSSAGADSVLPAAGINEAIDQGLSEGGRGTWNNSSFRKNADPFREVMGPGVDSHPEQWNALLKEMKDNGVEIVYREGAMAYSPAKGVAGQLVVDPSSSYSALLHEYTHYLDDVAVGFPGMEYHFQTINRVKMELHAYMQEIKLADSLGYKDVANQLFENYRAERELLAGHLK